MNKTVTWQSLTMQDIAVPENGIVDGPFGSNLKLTDYIEDIENGVPVLSTKNLDGSFSGVRYISKSKFEQLKRSKVEPGDIIVAKIGSIGKCGIYPQNRPTAMIPANLLKITPNDEVSTKYIYYYIKSAFFQELIQGISTATAQPAFNVTKFRRLPIFVPPLPEQKRIVSRIEELFSELDKAVETLQIIKQQLVVYRQAVLKEAFELSANSNLVEMSEIVDDIRIGPFGTMLHKSDYIHEGIPVINPQHIKNLTFYPTVSISEEKANELSAYRLQENDIVMGRRGEMGRSAAVTKEETGWLCGTGSIVFRLKPEYDASFYAQILASPDSVRFLEDNATGTTMKNLNEDIVKHIPVPNITRELQRKITVSLDEKNSVCDSIEQTVNTALAQADAMRQSILKQAFEGGLTQ